MIVKRKLTIKKLRSYRDRILHRKEGLYFCTKVTIDSNKIIKNNKKDFKYGKD